MPVVFKKGGKVVHKFKTDGVATQESKMALGSLGVKALPEGMKKVPLKDATALLQPTYGTSEKSEYRVVILGEGFNVSARHKGGSLSIRIEASNNDVWSDLKLVADTAGLSVHETHLSGHYHCPQAEMVCKTVGAVAATVSTLGIKAVQLDATYLYGVGK